MLIKVTELIGGWSDQTGSMEITDEREILISTAYIQTITTELFDGKGIKCSFMRTSSLSGGIYIKESLEDLLNLGKPSKSYNECPL